MHVLVDCFYKLGCPYLMVNDVIYGVVQHRVEATLCPESCCTLKLLNGLFNEFRGSTKRVFSFCLTLYESHSLL